MCSPTATANGSVYDPNPPGPNPAGLTRLRGDDGRFEADRGSVATCRPDLVGLQYITRLQWTRIVGIRQLHIKKFDRNTRASHWIWTVTNLEMQVRLRRVA